MGNGRITSLNQSITHNGTQIMTPLLEVVKDGKSYPMTPQELVHAVLYASYKHNRQHAPTLPVESWKIIFGEQVTALEARYQADIAVKP